MNTEVGGKGALNNREICYLKALESSAGAKASGHMTYLVILITLMGISMITGLLLSKVDISEISRHTRSVELKASFVLNEKKRPEPLVKRNEKPKEKALKPIKNPSLQREIKAENKMAEKKVAKRTVYGVRKIFSKGLGSGYGGRDAVVAKLGNSLDVTPDTIKATKNDLKGELVSVTKISAMPKILVSAKPEYTKEMKKNRITGKVRAKVLVDVDGYAKRIIIIKHLGYGTRLASINAIEKMKFKPGIKDNEPVAVWIPLTFRFELQV